MLPETVRNQDTLQWFYRAIIDNFSCLNGRRSPLHLRRNEHGLCIRVGNRWTQYRRNEQAEFWRDAMAVFPDLMESNWSTKRTQALWDYFYIYTPEIAFDNRRFFEMANCVLDGYTGELDYSEERFLTSPTTRSSPLPYQPNYTVSSAWQQWYDTMDENQRAVRDWSVGSAISGSSRCMATS